MKKLALLKYYENYCFKSRLMEQVNFVKSYKKYYFKMRLLGHLDLLNITNTNILKLDS